MGSGGGMPCRDLEKSFFSLLLAFLDYLAFTTDPLSSGAQAEREFGQSPQPTCSSWGMSFGDFKALDPVGRSCGP